MGYEIFILGERVEQAVPCSSEHRKMQMNCKSVKKSTKIEHCYKRLT